MSNIQNDIYNENTEELKKEIIDLTGEDPIDLLGPDWDLQAQEYLLQESING